MITQVNPSNKGLYWQLWKDATKDLTTHDAYGNPVEANSEEAVIKSEIDYAPVKIDISSWEPNRYYVKDTSDLSGNTYKKDTGEAFDKNIKYYEQYSTTISGLSEYFAYIKELACINPAKYTNLPLDEEVFEINANTRIITVPASFKTNGISVQGDKIAEILYFRVNRYFDMDDFDTKEIFVEWQTTNDKGISQPWVKDTASQPGYLIFGWPIDSAITAEAGDVTFSVRFYTVADESLSKELQYSWSTQPAKVSIKAGLNFPISDMIANESSDIVNSNTTILNRLQNSLISDLYQQAETPIFFEYDLENNFGDLPAEFDMEDDKLNLLMASAYAKDGGTITYDWYKSEWVPTYVEAVVEVDDYKPNFYYKEVEGEMVLATSGEMELDVQYYVARYVAVPLAGGVTKEPTKDDVREDNKIYFYIASAENVTPVVYRVYNGAISGGLAVDGDLIGKQLYETVASAEVDGIGYYQVKATNRANRTAATAMSTLCAVRPPDMPIISNIEDQVVLKEAKDFTETIYVTCSNSTVRGKTSYQWKYRQAGETEFKNIDEAKAPNHTIEGGAYGSAFEGDGFYKVEVFKKLNNDTVSVESNVAAVTHEVEVPEIKDKADLVGDNFTIEAFSNTEALEIEVALSGREDAMKAELLEMYPEDANGVSYQWCRFSTRGFAGQTDIEKAHLQAYEGTYTLRKDLDEVLEGETSSKLSNFTAGSQYFCQITNSYNGQSVTITSPVFIIYNN